MLYITYCSARIKKIPPFFFAFSKMIIISEGGRNADWRNIMHAIFFRDHGFEMYT